MSTDTRLCEREREGESAILPSFDGAALSLSLFRMGYASSCAFDPSFFFTPLQREAKIEPQTWVLFPRHDLPFIIIETPSFARVGNPLSLRFFLRAGPDRYSNKDARLSAFVRVTPLFQKEQDAVFAQPPSCADLRPFPNGCALFFRFKKQAFGFRFEREKTRLQRSDSNFSIVF